MVIERIDYYDEELGHCWASVDVRLVLKLFRCMYRICPHLEMI